jgi:hypothetical protein
MEISQGHSLSKLSQTIKNIMFFFLSFIFFLLQNQRKGEQNRSCLGKGGLASIGGGGGGEGG